MIHGGNFTRDSRLLRRIIDRSILSHATIQLTPPGNLDLFFHDRVTSFAIPISPVLYISRIAIFFFSALYFAGCAYVVYSVGSAMTTAAARARWYRIPNETPDTLALSRVSGRRRYFSLILCLHTLPCKHLAVSLRATIGMRLGKVDTRDPRTLQTINNLRPTPSLEH